jgi:capsular polysaccharide transport system ATP-binding protein
MLELENVPKAFWSGTQYKVLLEDVYVRVELGRSLGILTPNGTGQTTVINMMARLEKPDTGVIRRGCKISFPLGFMVGVVPRLSARDSARDIVPLYRLDPDYIEAYCRWLCGLEEYFDQPLGIDSPGRRARFSFALMLALDVDMYLNDERIPGSTGVEFNRKAGEILHERLRTTTIVIVSHDPRVIENFASSAAVLMAGELHMFETLEEAKELYHYETQG